MKNNPDILILPPAEMDPIAAASISRLLRIISIRLQICIYFVLYIFRLCVYIIFFTEENTIGLRGLSAFCANEYTIYLTYYLYYIPKTMLKMNNWTQL